MKRLLVLLLVVNTSLIAQDSCLQIKALLDQGNVVEAGKLLDETKDLTCYQLAGEVYMRKGRFDLANESFEKALAQANVNTEEEAASLNSLGIISWNKGDYFKANEFITRALNIRLKLYGENHEKTAASFNDLGLVLGASNPSGALKNYTKALQIYGEIFGEKSQKYAQTKVNIGIIYRGLQEFNKAETNFQDALTIWKKLFPEGHPNEGFIYTNLGLTSNAIGVYSLAESYYNQALEVYKKHYGEKHPEVAATYNLLGNLRNREGEFEEAIGLYHKSLISNSKTFNNTDIELNPEVGSAFNATTMLTTLYFKAQAYEDWHYNVTLKFKDLKNSLNALQSCDTLVDQIRRLQSNEADKLQFGSVASQVLESGVRVCYRMGEVAVKGKDEYNELAFYFNEKSKSGILLDAISDASAKHFADIPDQQLEMEANIKDEISFLERKLAEAPEDSLAGKYRQELFEWRSTYEDFVSQLEQNYPQYFNLKYNNSIPSIKDLQSTLDDETMLISYFLEEKLKRLYSFQITSKKFDIKNVPQGEDFQKNVNGMRNGIYYQASGIYLQTAKTLGKQLIPSQIPSNITKIIIIPVGRLGAIPFEALIRDKYKSKSVDFTQIPFVGKNYSFSYEYAAALYYQESTIGQKASKGNLALLCAPVEFEDLPRLPGTEKEINELKSILQKSSINSNVYTMADASESSIKSTDLEQYKYLHFATHGIVDEVNPELSRIYLAAEDGEEDGSLFSGEIYNIQLSADLVTLSACETGLGKVTKGEGIIGLSRALIYAGAKNIIVSLWKVSDNSTAELMIDFYDRIDGSQFSGSLREAKLELMKDPQYADPYYWAPFILIGK